MSVEQNRLLIREVNNELGLEIKISYFVLPKESIGALVRRVELINRSGRECALEVIDGLPKIIPYGIQNGQFKEMSNLFKSWTEIKNIENKAPFYTMRASSDDSAEVSEIQGGYFYCTVAEGALQHVIYDADTIFGYDTSLVTPVNFKEQGMEGVKKETQCFANKVPCGFTPVTVTLKPEESYEFASYIGYAGSLLQLNEATALFCQKDYVGAKEAQAVQVVKELVADVATSTADKVFDRYVEQCYLDNFLRGGYPYVFKGREKDAVVHLFSRKHGDPERDYNFFSIAGEYFSQGNGNFRDVCQNRRSDVFFKPEIGDFNVWSFFSYVQIDGYNPLEIRPCTFRVLPQQKAAALALVEAQVTGNTAPVEKLLDRNFTPGQICAALAENGLHAENEEALVAGILGCSEECLEAGFGEGYWSDHWDYLMDLVENYLQIFPDKKQELLFGRNDYRFYDSAGVVRPRKDTYVLSKGVVRQYGALLHSKEKESREGFTAGGTNWLKDKNGNEVTTTLLGKMLTLALQKFLLLDQAGMGIEMEGGKPGWNDAMNGLPGLFGSGMPETMELARLLDFLTESLKENNEVNKIELPEELAKLLTDIAALLAKKEALSAFDFWDGRAELREQFREKTVFFVSGEKKQVSCEEIKAVLQECLQVTKDGIAAAWKLGNGIMPTYLTYEAVQFEERKEDSGAAFITPYGLPGVKVTEFEQHIVPPFLEGPARMLSCISGMEAEKKEMYRAVKQSDIYDKKLKMYKTSGSIESVSMEHGRVRAFTPGWLERESIFLHMEYKYLLGLLRAGMYEEYYEAMKDALIPFQAPEVYGRSTLENSSFLASSANPDEKVHGRGFVARLSGSTTEMISMWISMFLGVGGFGTEQNELTFRVAPRLAAWLFDEKGEAAFTVLSGCELIYRNPERKNTYGADGVKVEAMKLIYADGHEESVTGDRMTGRAAEALREGKITKIIADCR